MNAAADSPWLIRLRPRPSARLHVACFPHGGGNASFFRSWAQRTPPDVEIIGVQYPGRMNRLSEPRIDAMAPMADAIAQVLDERLPAPFVLFGHSMGAAIAFEVALRLEREHRRLPGWVYVSGQTGPAHHGPGRWHLASDAALGTHLRGLGGTDAAVLDQPELRSLFMPVLRSDLKLIETWRPEPGARVRCPITAFTGDRDPEVEVDSARAWGSATTAAFELRVFPGGHFFLVEHEAALLREITGLGRGPGLAQRSAEPTHTS